MTDIEKRLRTIEQKLSEDDGYKKSTKLWAGVFAAAVIAWLGVTSFYLIPNAVNSWFGDQGKLEADQSLQEISRQSAESYSILERLKTEYKGINKNEVRMFVGECPESWVLWEEAKGRFLRGIDPTGSVDDVRTPGDLQDFSTSLPKTSFSLSGNGQHMHTITGVLANGGGNINDIKSRRGNGDKLTGFYEDSQGVGANGNHTHIISGGDNETRPINVAVNVCTKS